MRNLLFKAHKYKFIYCKVIITTWVKLRKLVEVGMGSEFQALKLGFNL
jgi:hypothetical protein